MVLHNFFILGISGYFSGSMRGKNIYINLFLQTSCLEIYAQLIAIHKSILSLVRVMYQSIKKGV